MKSYNYYFVLLCLILSIGCNTKKTDNQDKSSMGLFSSAKPYKNGGINFIYDLLFCDSLDLFKNQGTNQDGYPWNILLSRTSTQTDLLKIINDNTIESRQKVLAYNKLRASGYKGEKKELLGVIVEVGLDEGLDVLASFSDGTARYINHNESMIVWERTNDTSNALIKELFLESEKVVKQIGPWDKPRRKYPSKGIARITFLVSDGLYFGEGPINVLFDDPISGRALLAATNLMKYLTEKVLADK
jgi:hypothetical protein